jgi:hypothetical protein
VRGFSEGPKKSAAVFGDRIAQQNRTVYPVSFNPLLRNNASPLALDKCRIREISRFLPQQPFQFEVAQSASGPTYPLPLALPLL